MFKKLLCILCIVLLPTFFLTGCDDKNDDPPPLKFTPEDEKTPF